MENLFEAKINLKYLSFLLKRNTKLIILISVLMLALYPLLVFTEFVLGNNSYSAQVFTVGQVFILLILVASIFIVPLSLFSYLNSKRNLDVYHALPITRKDLYLSTLLSSIIIILIPYTIIYGLGTIYYVSVIENVDLMREIYQYIYTVVLSIAVLMPIIFAMMNTGTSIDGLLYSAMVHVLPAIGYGAYVLYGEAILLGFRVGADQLFLIFSSPIYTIFDLNFNLDRVYPNLWLITLYWLVFSFTATWIVLQLYKFRKSEKAENPFTNKWFFPIITTLFTIIFQVFLFSTFVAFTNGRLLDFRTLLFPVVFTFVGYMVLDVIANRGFKHFFKGLLNFVIITVVTLTSFTISASTGGLGYVTKVPKLDDVKEVSILLNDQFGLINASPYSYEYYMFDHVNGSMTFKDTTHIEAIIKTHQRILDGYKKVDYNKNVWEIQIEDNPFPFESSQYFDSNIRIEYTLKNGSTMQRQYQISSTWMYDLLPLIPTEEVFKNKYPALSLPSYDGYRLDTFRFSDPLLQTERGLQTLDYRGFKDVYKQDYISKSLQQHLEGAPIIGFVNLSICKLQPQGSCSSRSYLIDENDVNTIAYLQSNGFSLEHTYTGDNEYMLILPSNNEKRMLFYSFNNTMREPIFRSEVESRVDYVVINQEEINQLLPHLRTNVLLNQATGVVRVSDPTPFQQERVSPHAFFMLSPEAKNIVEQLKQGKEVRNTSYYDLFYVDFGY